MIVDSVKEMSAISIEMTVDEFTLEEFCVVREVYERRMMSKGGLSPRRSNLPPRPVPTFPSGIDVLDAAIRPDDVRASYNCVFVPPLENHESRSDFGEAVFLTWEAGFREIWENPDLPFRGFFPPNFRSRTDDQLVGDCRRLLGTYLQLLMPSRLIAFVTNLVRCKKIRELFVQKTRLVDLMFRFVLRSEVVNEEELGLGNTIELSTAPQMRFVDKAIAVKPWLWLLQSLLRVENRKVKARAAKPDVCRALFMFLRIDLSCMEPEVRSRFFIEPVSLALDCLAEISCRRGYDQARPKVILRKFRQIFGKEWNLRRFSDQCLAFFLEDRRSTVIRSALRFLGPFYTRFGLRSMLKSLCQRAILSFSLERLEELFLGGDFPEEPNETQLCYLNGLLGWLGNVATDWGNADLVWKIGGLRIYDLVLKLAVLATQQRYPEPSKWSCFSVGSLRFLMIGRCLPRDHSLQRELLTRVPQLLELFRSVPLQDLTWEERAGMVGIHDKFVGSIPEIRKRYFIACGEEILVHFTETLDCLQPFMDPKFSPKMGIESIMTWCVRSILVSAASVAAMAADDSYPELANLKGMVEYVFFSEGGDFGRVLILLYNLMTFYPISERLALVVSSLLDGYRTRCVCYPLDPAEDMHDFFSSWGTPDKLQKTHLFTVLNLLGSKLLAAGIESCEQPAVALVLVKGLAILKARVEDPEENADLQKHLQEAMTRPGPCSEEFLIRHHENRVDRSHDCQVCGKPNSSKKCSGCRSVYYCSRECQLRHWKVHKKTCPRLDRPTASKKKNRASRGRRE